MGGEYTRHLRRPCPTICPISRHRYFLIVPSIFVASQQGLILIIITDEPRRSGRATKGQHTKNLEVAIPAPAKSAKRPKKARKTGQADDDEPEEEEEEGEEEEDGNAIIRCVCGDDNEDPGGLMVCCDGCSCWQHNKCMGLPQSEKALPDTYLCERCSPEDHRLLLAKMARGEKPWEGRGWKRPQEAERKVRTKQDITAKNQESTKQQSAVGPTPDKTVAIASFEPPTPTLPKKRKSRGGEEEEEEAAKGEAVQQVENGAEVRT